MLSGVGLGQEFWAEAVETACYLVNRSPSSTLEDKTPQEGYKLWDPATRKVVYIRDVGFKEVKDVIKHEVQPKEPKKIKFELKEEELDSTAEEESEDEEPQTPGVTRLVREGRQLESYSPYDFCSNFALPITDDDPRTMKEAVDSEDGKLWKEAMVDEMASLHKNEAWDLVELLDGKKPIGSKWVFKKKTNAEGKVETYKARLVVKGYSQVSGIDFGDIFSPDSKVTSIRLILSVAATFDFEVEQMDVKTTFLHGDLEEEIYMKQPEGCAVNGKKELCPKTQEEEEDMSRVPYASVIGSLMYEMVCTRPDISLAVGVLGRFMSKPRKEHWTAMKQVFKYLCGTSDYGLCYQGRPRLDRVLDIHGFVDADWLGDLDQRRSTSGYVFNLFGGAVSWMSKKQSVVALSTTEAEYMATTHASKEAVRLQRLCSSMGLVKGAIRIYYDSQCEIFLEKNPAYHSKTKHIDV
eukprot:PITA_10456